MTSVDVFALVILPAIIAVSGYVAVFCHKRLARRWTERVKTMQLSQVLSEFDRTFLNLNNRYTEAQVRLIQTPMAFCSQY